MNMAKESISSNPEEECVDTYPRGPDQWESQKSKCDLLFLFGCFNLVTHMPPIAHPTRCECAQWVSATTLPRTSDLVCPPSEKLQ